MQNEEQLPERFRIEVEYPKSVREFIRTEARRVLAKGGRDIEDIFHFADEAAIFFDLTPTYGFGEGSGFVFGMVCALVGGVRRLLAGNRIVVHGMYQSYCFEPDVHRGQVYMSRGRYPENFEDEEELRRELGAPPSDVKETPRPAVDSDEGARELEWRRAERPIPLREFVEECLSAGGKVIEVYRAECPPEILACDRLRNLICWEARAREAWGAFRRGRPAT